VETCTWIELTNEAEWEPNSSEFMEAEEACVNANNSINLRYQGSYAISK